MTSDQCRGLAHDKIRKQRIPNMNCAEYALEPVCDRQVRIFQREQESSFISLSDHEPFHFFACRGGHICGDFLVSIFVVISLSGVGATLECSHY